VVLEGTLLVGVTVGRSLGLLGVMGDRVLGDALGNVVEGAVVGRLTGHGAQDPTPYNCKSGLSGGPLGPGVVGVGHSGLEKQANLVQKAGRLLEVFRAETDCHATQ
jgi:hypothetical protein